MSEFPRAPGRRNLLDRRLMNSALWIAIVLTTLVVLREGKDIFVPLVIAIVAVYLVTVLSGTARRIRIAGRQLPTAVTMFMSFAIIFGFGYALFAIIADNAMQVASVVPNYQTKFLKLQHEIFSKLHIEEPNAFRDVVGGLDLKSIFTTVATSVGALLGRLMLILLYSLFILLELRFLQSKIDALFPNPAKREMVMAILSRIDRDIHTYLGVKTLVSALTAICAYIIMRLVALPFAEFWAMLIFILNFIPTIGSIVATLLPTLLAAVHFETLGPFLVVGLGITGVQQLLGSIIEPNLMGHTLNISPLVVFVSLILWGYIWGILGMFLCVPITVALVIVLSNFPTTRWVAILLSKGGRIRPT